MFFALTDALDWGRFGWAAYDCSGVRLYDGDMAGGGGKFTLALAGTNYVRVYGLGTNTGPYSFTISKLPAEPITDRSLTPVTWT